MVTRTCPRARRIAVAVAVAVCGGIFALSSPSAANHQTVNAVRGSATGYHAFNLTLFGGPQPSQGPAPVVTLTSDASNSPQSASLSFGAVILAETATILSWDSIAVSTAGTLGASGSVTSSATLTSVNKANPANVPTTGGEFLTADTLASTCTASEATLSGRTTITNGRLRTDSGLQVNFDDDYTDPGEIAPVDVTLPANPAPNTVYTGVIRFSATSVENFRVILNEQIMGPGVSITVNAAHYFFGTPGIRLVGEMIVGQSVCGVTLEDLPPTTRRPPADFDGSGSTDVSVFRPANGAWYLRTASPAAIVWGQSGDVPVPGDYDGNGTTDLAVFRPANNAWYVRTASPFAVVWGAPGDIPVPGDYDGNGTTDIAVFRPANGTWYLRTATPTAIVWGQSGDIPVPGDYDGNGTLDLAVFRPGNNTWYLRTATPTAVVWGAPGDIPVPGRYDDNTSTDIAVFRPANGTWYLRTASPTAIVWGQSGDIPQPGDYDGNGITDLAVYRPANNAWYVRTASPFAVVWGTTGDRPLPLPDAIRRFF